MYATALQSDVSRLALPAHIRARGTVALRVRARDGVSVRENVREEGGLRLRFPREPGAGLSSVIVNTAGGMTGGDVACISVVVGEGAHLSLTTSAAEKMYRSLGDAARIQVALRAEAGAVLTFAPQEAIVFDGARVERVYEVDAPAGASVLLCDMTCLGRRQMGEVVRNASLRDRWRIYRDGGLAYADQTRIEGDCAAILSGAAVAGGADSFASMMYFDDKVEEVCESWRSLLAESADGVHGGAGIVNGVCVARLVAGDLFRLRAVCARLICAVPGRELPRSWLT